jgi:rod shape-determining protein MreC
MFRFIRHLKFSVILLAVVILLIFFHYLGITRPVEDLLIRIFSPVQSMIYNLGSDVNNFYLNISSKKNLEEENKKLVEEVNRLTIENAQLNAMIGENQEISLQQKFLTANGLQAITAKVVGRNPEPNLQSIILNKGSNDGIKVDYPLVINDGIMVGKIYRVKGNSAEAILVNDSRSRIAAMVQNESNSKGVLVGEHGLSLRLELIPKNEVVKEGDLVVTSGVEPTIPKGLVIGKIGKIANEANSAFQTAWIQPLLRINNLIIVSVLKSPSYD